MKTLPAIEATSTLSNAVVQAVKAPHRPVLVIISGDEIEIEGRSTRPCSSGAIRPAIWC